MKLLSVTLNKRFNLGIIPTLIFAFILALFFTTCQKDEPAPKPEIEYIEYGTNKGIIGAGGGEITVKDSKSLVKGASITVPPEALKENIEITIDEGFELDIFGNKKKIISFKPDGTIFQKSVLIGVPISGNSLSNIGVFYIDRVNGITEELNLVKIDENSRIAYAYVNHFSDYYAGEKEIEMHVSVGKSGSKLAVSGGPHTAIERILYQTNILKDQKSIKEYLNTIEYIPIRVRFSFTLTDANYVLGLPKTIETKYIYLEIWPVYNIILPEYYFEVNDLKYNINIILREFGKESVVVSTISNVSKEELCNIWMLGKATRVYFDLQKLGYLNEKLTIRFSWSIPLDFYHNSYRDSHIYGIESESFKFSTLDLLYSGDLDENCVPDNLEASVPVVVTSPIITFDQTTASLKATITSDGKSTITEQGFYYDYTNKTPSSTDISISATAVAQGAFGAQAKNLMAGKTYYVRAWAKNSKGIGVSNNVESFTTLSSNQPPVAPSNPNPTNNSTGISTALSLTWDCTDPDGDDLAYDVYFGTTNPPISKVGSFQTSKSLYRSGLNYSTPYYWQVIAFDSKSNSISGPIWKFTTSNSGISPVSDFNASKTNISKGESILFTDLSKNNPTSWLWTFSNDGSSSTIQNPSKVFLTVGVFTVSLKVSNDFGSDIKTINIGVSEPGSIIETSTFYYNGYTYKTVKIGAQWWFAENLKTTNYNDFTAIPNVTYFTDWLVLTSGAYCWYLNDANTYEVPYGAMYNWYAVNTGKLCPTGWHVPKNDEYDLLVNFLIGNGFNYDGTTSGHKIAKSMASTTKWRTSTNSGAVGNNLLSNNRSGFSGFPGGYRTKDGADHDIGYTSYWWTATEGLSTFAYSRVMWYDNIFFDTSQLSKRYGFYVRCVKD